MASDEEWGPNPFDEPDCRCHPSRDSGRITSVNPFDETGPTYIMQAMHELGLTLSSKNEDYRIDGEFSNFEFAAQFTGPYTRPDQVMLTQIGIKLGRLHGLPADPNNESRLDTLKDLAGYAIILYAYALRSARG